MNLVPCEPTKTRTDAQGKFLEEIPSVYKYMSLNMTVAKLA